MGTVLPLSLALLGATAALAQKPDHPQSHPPEVGRELIGADGRTLTDKQNKFSIRLPAADWKVFRDVDPGPEPFLNIANPDWELRLELRVKALPLPLDTFKQYADSGAKTQGGKVLRSAIAVRDGMRCLELEGEQTDPPPAPQTLQHYLGRVCDLDAGHKLTLGINIPAAQWPAEEKTLREMAESLRIIP
jgi:hypothetical protein